MRIQMSAIDNVDRDKIQQRFGFATEDEVQELIERTAEKLKTQDVWRVVQFLLGRQDD